MKKIIEKRPTLITTVVITILTVLSIIVTYNYGERWEEMVMGRFGLHSKEMFAIILNVKASLVWLTFALMTFPLQGGRATNWQSPINKMALSKIKNVFGSAAFILFIVCGICFVLLNYWYSPIIEILMNSTGPCWTACMLFWMGTEELIIA
ncbi:MAG: hypothetical protein J6W96_06310 [Alphaproteobacteria bacterium]|nr:hypothetical protein [Alphaproteobacteria bacterium]